MLTEFSCGVVPGVSSELLVNPSCYSTFASDVCGHAHTISASTSFILDNVERFSLADAAHKRPRVNSAAEIRVGERKTGWTKPLPRTPTLWALNGPGYFVDGRNGHSSRRFGAVRPVGRVLEELTVPGIDCPEPVRAHALIL